MVIILLLVDGGRRDEKSTLNQHEDGMAHGMCRSGLDAATALFDVSSYVYGFSSATYVLHFVRSLITSTDERNVAGNPSIEAQ